MKLKQFLRGMVERTHKSARFGIGLTVGLIAVLVAFNTVLYGLAGHFSWYFYSEDKLEHMITSATDKYLGDVANIGDVRIIFCDSQDNLESDSVYNLVWQTANQFAARHDFISVENVNIFINPDKVEPYKYQVDKENGGYVLGEDGKPVQINTVNRNSVIIVGAVDYVVMPMSTFFVLDEEQSITAYNGEEITASMIRRVQNENKPKAYFTISHGETYAQAFYNRLLCAGYELFFVDLMVEDITAGEGDIIVVSNPRYDFVRGNADKGVVAELEKIEAFLSDGGTLWTMLDPLVTNTVFLESFLSTWGITVDRVDVEGQREVVMVRDPVDSVTTDGYSLITSPSGSTIADEMATEMKEVNAGRVIVSQASPLSLAETEGKTVSSVLTTSASSRAYAAGNRVDTNGNYTVAAVSRDAQTGGGIFVVSSVYLTAQDAITTNEYGNRDFLFSLFHHLCGVEVPRGCTYLLFSPTTLEDLTMQEARLWTALFVGVLPAAAIICGVVVLGKRRYR